MSNQSFADLGISPAVRNALAKRASQNRFQSRSSSSATRSAGMTCSSSRPPGSGKTLAFAAPIVDRLEAGERRPAALDRRPDPRARAADRRGDPAARQCARPLGRRRLRRRRHPQAGEARPPGAHPRRHAGPPARPHGARRRLARRASASSSSTRPTGCSTWAFAPTSTGSSAQTPRTARRCSSRRRSTARSTASPRRYTRLAACATSTPPEARHPRRAPLRRCLAREQASTRSSTSSAPTASLALVFVRTKRGADRLVKRLGSNGVEAVAMHGNKSQNQRERRWRASTPARSTPWSRPTSRRAASTSTGSAT